MKYGVYVNVCVRTQTCEFIGALTSKHIWARTDNFLKICLIQTQPASSWEASEEILSKITS
jgi:hypothetical protein